MIKSASRLVSLLLAVELALLTAGCGQPAAPAAQRAALPAVTQAAVPVAKTGAPAAVSAAQTKVTLSPGREVVEGPDAPVAFTPVAPVAPTRDGLFDADFDKTRLYQHDLKQDDPEALAETDRQVKVAGGGSMITPGGGMGWGLIGGGIAAGIVGASLFSYAIYTGMVGSKDLMYPEVSTEVNLPDYPFSRVLFDSHDGLNLVGWYVPAEVPTTKGIVLFHGHTSNKDSAFNKYGAWLHRDYNVFVYDSRYHGESAGKFTTLGYYERRDALLAIEELRKQGNTTVGVMGESMGGAVAIAAGAMDPSVKAVWADCAFDSLHDAIGPRATARKYPMPDYVALSVVKTASIRAKGNLAAADPIKWVDKIAPRPLYLVHGQKDDDTTPMNSDKLFAKAGHPKSIWRTAEADHAESWAKYPDEYKTRLQAFFLQAMN